MKHPANPHLKIEMWGTHRRLEVDRRGPPAFYRSFTGRADAHPVEVRTAYEQKAQGLTGNLLVRLRSTAGKAVNVEIKDNAYQGKPVTRTVEPRQEISVVLPLERSHGWYDFTVKASGSDAETRVAGRVETGKTSFSDPLMGGMV